jgi:hypothetical protein
VVVVLNAFNLLGGDSMMRYIWGWFGGNLVAGILFNFLLLRLASRMVEKLKIFVKKWWA